jgi:hypothetical protein
MRRLDVVRRAGRFRPAARAQRGPAAGHDQGVLRGARSGLPVGPMGQDAARPPDQRPADEAVCRGPEEPIAGAVHREPHQAGADLGRSEGRAGRRGGAGPHPAVAGPRGGGPDRRRHRPPEASRGADPQGHRQPGPAGSQGDRKEAGPRDAGLLRPTSQRKRAAQARFTPGPAAPSTPPRWPTCGRSRR